MENIKNMERRNTSRAGVKQTSTPLNDNKELVFLKTLSNVSSIQNENRRKRHFVLESPSTFDLWRSLENSRTTESSENSSESLEEISKQRPDTPFKSQKKVRFSAPSFVCPVKLRFSEVSSSSSANSKQSKFIRYCSSTVNKHLLCTDKKPENSIADKVCLKRTKNHELPSEKAEKDIYNFNFGQHANAKFYEKRKKPLKSDITRERNEVTENLQAEKEIDIQEILDSSNTVLIEDTCNEGDFIKTKSTSKEAKKLENTSNSVSKHQDKGIVISNNLINETIPSDGKFDKTICPGYLVTETTEAILQQGVNEGNAEKVKESDEKAEKESGKRNEPKKKVRPQSTASDETVVLNSYNTQSSSDKGVTDEIHSFKKPFTVKKNGISKISMVEKRKKRKAISLFPPTSTPLDSPAAAKEKLPMVFESLSPVRSPEKGNKSYYSDDFQIYGIKVKRTYSKAANFNAESDKEDSKWESFLKKTSYPRKSSNYVSEISMSEKSNSINLFDSPPNTDESVSVPLVPKSSLKESKASERISQQDIDQAASVDHLIPTSRLKKRKAFETISRQTHEGSSVDHLVPRSRMKISKDSEGINRQDKTGSSAKTANSKAKKWFETTKLKEMAARFNEISDTSLIIEVVPKK